jgi:hypothetical protein
MPKMHNFEVITAAHPVTRLSGSLVQAQNEALSIADQGVRHMAVVAELRIALLVPRTERPDIAVGRTLALAILVGIDLAGIVLGGTVLEGIVLEGTARSPVEAVRTAAYVARGRDTRLAVHRKPMPSWSDPARRLLTEWTTQAGRPCTARPVPCPARGPCLHLTLLLEPQQPRRRAKRSKVGCFGRHGAAAKPQSGR